MVTVLPLTNTVLLLAVGFVALACNWKELSSHWKLMTFEIAIVEVVVEVFSNNTKR